MWFCFWYFWGCSSHWSLGPVIPREQTQHLLTWAFQCAVSACELVLGKHSTTGRYQDNLLTWTLPRRGMGLFLSRRGNSNTLQRCCHIEIPNNFEWPYKYKHYLHFFLCCEATDAQKERHVDGDSAWQQPSWAEAWGQHGAQVNLQCTQGDYLCIDILFDYIGTSSDTSASYMNSVES